MKTEHSDHHCPTCGSEVVIHSSDEGTSYMEPKHSDQETSSLREQLKEKEEEILYVELELKQKLRLLRSCEIALEKRDKQLQSKSKLIESLAGALDNISKRSQAVGTKNATYGNTGMDSEAVAYGFNECRELYQSIATKALYEYNNYKNKQNGN